MGNSIGGGGGWKPQDLIQDIQKTVQTATQTAQQVVQGATQVAQQTVQGMAQGLQQLAEQARQEAVRQAAQQFTSTVTTVVQQVRAQLPAPLGTAPDRGLIGLAQGSENRDAVRRLQSALVRTGFMTEDQLGPMQNSGFRADHGTFGRGTAVALARFQQSQGLLPTGVVDEATAVALANPHTGPQVDPRLQTVAAGYASVLGPTEGAAEELPDGTVRQDFERGYIERQEDGTVRVVSPGVGLDQTFRPGDALASVQAREGELYLNQMEGDPERGNGNCGFASSLNALRLLNLPNPPQASIEGGGEDYLMAMTLRDRGGAGSDDGVVGDAFQIRDGINLSGGHAEVVDNFWNNNPLQAGKGLAVELMRRELMDPSRQEAFIVAGNPTGSTDAGGQVHDAWSANSDYNGPHWVTVAGYDPAKDVFIVVDSYSTNPGPFEVTPAQLEAYLADEVGATTQEVIRVTAPPEQPLQVGRAPIAG